VVVVLRSLLLFSDGLTEARNDNGEFFGEERLKNILLKNSKLSSQYLGERIVSFVNQFKDNAKIHDDMTIAIVRKT